MENESTVKLISLDTIPVQEVEWLVAVIVIICLIGLIVGSCFGIFFSGEDTGTGQTMQTVVREINEDYENQLDTIKANISYDVLEMSGSRAV